MTRFSLVKLTLAAVLGAAILAAPAAARPGDVEKGKAVYAKRCILCHGVEGDGDGAAAERLSPPPRDFTEGQYKFRTTHFDDALPNDEDLFRMISDGMPGTAMPGWSDVLSEQDMWDLVAHLKVFGGLEEDKPEKQLDYGSQIASSPESIAAGRKLFLDRCVECHGEDGKGDAIKKLKDDGGARTWPRNLTKPWTFRVGDDARDIFARISVGIPTTQMPAFSDPKSKKKLGIDERWHVANYVRTLAKTKETVRPENTVVQADRVDGALPTSPDDAAWDRARPSTFFLVPQIIAKTRFFTPVNDTVTVRALYDATALALLIEWDDRTRSIPGDKKAETIAEGGLAEDAVAVQFPVSIPAGMEKPYFIMGDAARPVNSWQWHSGTTQAPAGVRLLDGRGAGDVVERDAARAGLQAKASYKAGTWRVVMTRPRAADPEKDIRFVAGRFIPIAFSAWDGSNGEAGSKHTLTTWYWLLLKPPTGARPVLMALLVILLVAAGEFWWLRSAAKGRSTPT